MVSASLKDIVESYEVGFNIGIGISDAVAYSCLCSKVYNNLRLILGEEVLDKLFVGNVALYEGKEGWVLFQLFKRFYLRRTS